MAGIPTASFDTNQTSDVDSLFLDTLQAPTDIDLADMSPVLAATHPVDTWAAQFTAPTTEWDWGDAKASNPSCETVSTTQSSDGNFLSFLNDSTPINSMALLPQSQQSHNHLQPSNSHQRSHSEATISSLSCDKKTPNRIFDVASTDSQNLQRRQRWTQEEVETLKRGVAVHGVGNFDAILSDPLFASTLGHRQRASLHRKWGRLHTESPSSTFDTNDLWGEVTTTNKRSSFLDETTTSPSTSYTNESELATISSSNSVGSLNEAGRWNDAETHALQAACLRHGCNFDNILLDPDFSILHRRRKSALQSKWFRMQNPITPLVPHRVCTPQTTSMQPATLEVMQILQNAVNIHGERYAEILDDPLFASALRQFSPNELSQLSQKMVLSRAKTALAAAEEARSNTSKIVHLNHQLQPSHLQGPQQSSRSALSSSLILMQHAIAQYGDDCWEKVCADPQYCSTLGRFSPRQLREQWARLSSGLTAHHKHTSTSNLLVSADEVLALQQGVATYGPDWVAILRDIKFGSGLARYQPLHLAQIWTKLLAQQKCMRNQERQARAAAAAFTPHIAQVVSASIGSKSDKQFSPDEVLKLHMAVFMLGENFDAILKHSTHGLLFRKVERSVTDLQQLWTWITATMHTTKLLENNASLKTLTSRSLEKESSEIQALRDGVNLYGEGNWDKIKTDTRFSSVLKKYDINVLQATWNAYLQSLQSRSKETLSPLSPTAIAQTAAVLRSTPTSPLAVSAHLAVNSTSKDSSIFVADESLSALNGRSSASNSFTSKNVSTESPRAPSKLNVRGNSSNSRWTEKEIEMLKLAVQEHGEMQWKEILADPKYALYLSNRGIQSLQRKWQRMHRSPVAKLDRTCIAATAPVQSLIPLLTPPITTPPIATPPSPAILLQPPTSNLEPASLSSSSALPAQPSAGTTALSQSLNSFAECSSEKQLNDLTSLALSSSNATGLRRHDSIDVANSGGAPSKRLRTLEPLTDDRPLWSFDQKWMTCSTLSTLNAIASPPSSSSSSTLASAHHARALALALLQHPLSANIDDSLASLDDAELIYGNDRATIVDRALIHCLSGRDKACVDNTQNIPVNLECGDARQLTACAVALLLTGDVERCIECCEAALLVEPTALAALVCKAQAITSRGDDSSLSRNDAADALTAATKALVVNAKCEPVYDLLFDVANALRRH